MRIWRHAPLAAVVLICAAIGVAALWPEPLAVDIVPVARGPMRVTVDEDGVTRVRERFVVSAPVAGRLERIELEPGDRVVRGSPIVRLVPAAAPLLDARTRTALSAAVEAALAAHGEAQAGRDRAAAAADRARSAMERLTRLSGAGAISLDELEEAQKAAATAEATLRSADFAVSRASYELQLARARLQDSRPGGASVNVTSPASGVVLRRLRESESVVGAGEPLLEIGDPRQLEVVADLLSTDVVRLASGCAVFIDDWGGGRTLAGHIRRIEPSWFMKVSALGVEEQRVNVIIDFADPEAAAQQLGDAYKVEVRAVVWEKADAVKVPVGALTRQGDHWAVFAVDGGRAGLRVVDVGQRNNEEAEVITGVTPGQQVILHPPDSLKDGGRVAQRSR